MFCLMDVSGSMTEHMKDLAKRFFMLLHLFLKRRYKHVEIVFIRHTHEAKEVDEETFFYSRETGGTVVSTGASRRCSGSSTERYPPSDWNIYAAQASDGDNVAGRQHDLRRAAAATRSCRSASTSPISRSAATSDRMPTGFIDAPDRRSGGPMSAARRQGADFAMRKVSHRRDIFPVFRELFRRRDAEAETAAP